MARGQVPGRARGGVRGGGLRRERRSRELVSKTPVDAVAQLLAELPSGRVTVREIAADLSQTTDGRRDSGLLYRATVGALLGESARRGGGLDGMPDEELNAAIPEVLREIAGLAFQT